MPFFGAQIASNRLVFRRRSRFFSATGVIQEPLRGADHEFCFQRLFSVAYYLAGQIFQRRWVKSQKSQELV